MPLDLQGVHSAINAYFDGFYGSDAPGLARVFHCDASLYHAANGKVSKLTLEDYLALVEKREPVSVAKRTEAVLSVSFAGSDVAVARLAVANASTSFSDFLVLVRESDGWKIVTKAYHADPL
jgi:hypothetical protein